MSVRTFGIDISRYSKKIDWRKIAASLNPRFVLAEAFHMGPKPADCYADSHFEVYWAELGELRIPRSAYLFCDPKADPHESAQSLFSTWQPRVGDMVPTLDIEDNFDNDCGLPVSTRLQRIKTTIEAISARIGGMRPLIYTNKRVWNDLNNSAMFSDCPLWVYDYDNESPLLPPPWSKYTIWQFAKDKVVDGIEGDYQPNYFNGAEAEIGSLLIREVAGDA